MIAIFSALAVMIACLGLSGLSSFTILQRKKEVGIRKVMGASVPQIVSMLSGDFIRLVLIASLIALPAGYFLMEEWLSQYAVRINVNVWVFIVPFLLMIFISMMTVSIQTVKAAHTNPVNTLKNE